MMNLKKPLPIRGRTLGGLSLLAVGLTALIVTTGFVSDPSHPTPEPVDRQELAPGTAALRVVLDPETGQLTHASSSDKTADAELQNMMNRSDAGLVEIKHPDGHVSVHLEGRFMSASVARLDEDGRAQTACFERADDAAAFLAGAQAATHADDREVR